MISYFHYVQLEAKETFCCCDILLCYLDTNVIKLLLNRKSVILLALPFLAPMLINKQINK